MITRVILAKKLLASFRKKAQSSYPNEVMNTLWGKLEGSTAIVEELHDFDQHATGQLVNYTDADTMAPAGRGIRFLGTIHTHPDCTDASPSAADWTDAFGAGEHIFAVMKIVKHNNKFKTEVAFWEPRPQITIIHPRVRKAAGTKSSTSSAQCVVDVTSTENVGTLEDLQISVNGTILKSATTGATHYE